MKSMREVARHVHWRWVLPTMTVAVTLVLCVEASIQSQSYPFRGWDMPGDTEAPAFILAKLINGPAFFSVFRVPLGSLTFDNRRLDLESLPASAALWFLLGLALERRLQQRPAITRRWLRLVLFIPVTVLSALLLYVDIHLLRFHGMLPFQHVFRVVVPRFGWWSPSMSGYPLMLWLLAGTVYFGSRVWTTMRPA